MDATDPDQPSTPFAVAVDRVLRSLKPGDVVSYGEVAAEAGRPGAARAVGRVLATSDGEYPWWRVVTASGRLASHKVEDQAARLRAEGVEVVDGRVRGGRTGCASAAGHSRTARRPSRSSSD